MNNSIQYFLENVIPGLEKIKKDFFTNPMCFDKYIENVKNIVSVSYTHLTLPTIRHV